MVTARYLVVTGGYCLILVVTQSGISYLRDTAIAGYIYLTNINDSSYGLLLSPSFFCTTLWCGCFAIYNGALESSQNNMHRGPHNSLGSFDFCTDSWWRLNLHFSSVIMSAFSLHPCFSFSLSSSGLIRGNSW